MIKIAYDLDGVLVPDCDVIPFLGGIEEFYNLSTYMRPLFQPIGEYSIITARLPQYKNFTQTWIDKYIQFTPIQVFHDIEYNMTPQKYKAKTIIENNIDVYVESDKEIVDYLKMNTTAKIIHFSEYISMNFI